MPSWEEIDAISSLIIAIVAMIAIFWPDLEHWAARPRFSIEARKALKQPYGSNWLVARVTNRGRSVAHGTVAMLDVFDQNGKLLCEGRRMPLIESLSYDEVSLYPGETLGFAILRVGSFDQAHPMTCLEVTVKPFRLKPSHTYGPLTCCEATKYTGVDRCIEVNAVYMARVRVGCEENSRMDSVEFRFKYDGNDVEIVERGHCVARGLELTSTHPEERGLSSIYQFVH